MAEVTHLAGGSPSCQASSIHLTTCAGGCARLKGMGVGGEKQSSWWGQTESKSHRSQNYQGDICHYHCGQCGDLPYTENPGRWFLRLGVTELEENHEVAGELS